MMHLFQRIVPNEFGWIYPSPGRLKDPNSSDIYLDFTGFGHEDWNFNTDFVINGWVYGYLYYDTPAKPDEKYNIAFAVYEPRNGWYLAGFYLDAEFEEKGVRPPRRVLTQKSKHLLLLKENDSLGNEYSDLTDAELADKIRDDGQFYRWRVRPQNVLALNPPTHIPPQVLTSQAYRYRRPQFLTQPQFDALRQFANRVTAQVAASEPDEDYFEGDQFETTHKSKERSRELVVAAKARFRRLHGRLFCEACGFDFENRYGMRGNDFIEAHHIHEHHKLRGRTRVRIEDLAMLCANCHRIVHRRTPALSLEQLKALIVPADQPPS